jgi:predicted transcriptional regulator
MTKEDAIKLAGTQQKLADILGIYQGAVSQWKTIPEARIWQLKVLKPKWFKKGKK